MPGRKTAWTDDAGRHYTCRSCGKTVVIPRWKWSKLRTDQKRLCPRCAEIQNHPMEPRYAPYGPYHFGFM